MSSDSDRRQQTIEDRNDGKAACVALVPLVASAQWSRIPDQYLSRADSGFVTHLIATAEHAPQTRSLRRAAPSEAQSAYTAQRAESLSGLAMRRTV